MLRPSASSCASRTATARCRTRPWLGQWQLPVAATRGSAKARPLGAASGSVLALGSALGSALVSALVSIQAAATWRRARARAALTIAARIVEAEGTVQTVQTVETATATQRRLPPIRCHRIRPQ